MSSGDRAHGENDGEDGEARRGDGGGAPDRDVAGGGYHRRAGSGKHQQEGPECLGKQSAGFKGGIAEAVHPPRFSLGARAKRPRHRSSSGRVLGRAIQLLQSSLPGTRASSSIRWAADTRWYPSAITRYSLMPPTSSTGEIAIPFLIFASFSATSALCFARSG